MNNTEQQKTDQFKALNDPNSASQEVFSDDPELNGWLKEGISLLESKKYKDAIRLFEKVLRVDPDNMTAFEKLSIARSVQGDLDRIQEYLAMGQELMNQRDWSGAVEEFQAILNIDSEHDEAKMLLKQSMGHLEDSGEDSESLISTGGDDVFSFSNDNSAISDPNLLMDDQETVQIDLVDPGDSIDKDASDPEFQRKLEDALRIYENGNLEKAKSLLEELQQQYPGQAQIQFYLTAIGRRFETEQVREDQLNVEEMFKRAMDFIEAQEFDNAKRLLHEIVSKRPDFDQATLMLDRIDQMAANAPQEKSSRSKEKRQASRSSTSGNIRDNLPPPPKPQRPGANRTVFILGGVVLVIIIAVVAFFMFQYPKMRFNSLTDQAIQRIDDKAYIEAAALLESALVIQPDDIKNRTRLGDVYMAAEQYLNAVDQFKKVFELDRTDQTIQEKIADAYYAAGEWQNAIDEYRKIEGILKYKEKALFRSALALKNMGNLDGAIQGFKKTLLANDAHSKAHFELAKCLEEKELFEETEIEYQLAISTEPKFVEGYETLSDFYFRQEAPEKAAEVLTRLLTWFKPTTMEKSEKVARLREKLGEAQYAAGDYKGAVESFTQVIQISPSVDAFRNLGRSHYKDNKLTEAILVWNRGLKMDDQDADLWFQIAVAQYRQRDISSAENSYKEALRIAPDHVKALTNLGFLYYKKYDFDLARSYWKQSLAIDPDQEVIQKKLKEIEKK